MAFCKKAGDFLRKWFKKVDTFLLDNTELAVIVVGRFKVIIDNPVMDIITQIIPGNIDDVIKQSLRKGVNLALDKLVTLSGCNNMVTVEEKLLCYANFLKDLPKEIRDAQLFKFASLLSAELDNKRFDQKDYDLITQSVYTAK